MLNYYINYFPCLIKWGDIILFPIFDPAYLFITPPLQFQWILAKKLFDYIVAAKYVTPNQNIFN